MEIGKNCPIIFGKKSEDLWWFFDVLRIFGLLKNGYENENAKKGNGYYNVYVFSKPCLQESFLGCDDLLENTRKLYNLEMTDRITKSLKDMEYKTIDGTVLDICHDQVERHIDEAFDKTIKDSVKIYNKTDKGFL